MLRIEVKGNSIKAIRKETDRFIDTVSQDLLQNLKTYTPIDKGFARKSWQTEKRLGSINVVNRAPYIESLERGHSKQAPRGMVRPAINNTLRRTK